MVVGLKAAGIEVTGTNHLDLLMTPVLLYFQLALLSLLNSLSLSFPYNEVGESVFVESQ